MRVLRQTWRSQKSLFEILRMRLKTEELRNDLPFTTTCLAKLYVWGRRRVNGRPVVWTQRRTTYMNTCKFYCWQRHTFAMKALLSNIQYCYTVNSYMQLNNNRMNCCVYAATTVTRTRHNVTLHVLCLSCSYLTSAHSTKAKQLICKDKGHVPVESRLLFSVYWTVPVILKWISLITQLLVMVSCHLWWQWPQI